MATHTMLWLLVSVLFLGNDMGGGELDIDRTRMTRIKQIITDLVSKNNQQLSVPSASSAFRPLRETYIAEIGVRETTGNNDGPRIAEYLRYCGLGEGYEWCAAFVSWCHGQAGYPGPRNAWAAALFPEKRIVWRIPNVKRLLLPMNRDRNDVSAGDIFGIYSTTKKRIAHCGFVDDWDGTWCITVEGNAENAVVRKRRLVKTIYAVSRWTDHGTPMTRM
ncbi:CHAP domain-containing protein [Parapedobacter tibetensis]|uniref:CHAP domain-containing protein n=1 Tax=Parapedobacter tibetensis TaxID=2972951 RepID=UPI00214D401E|nr:CHAP domain-containing protein [Parapedobacter tibetensis]